MAATTPSFLTSTGPAPPRSATHTASSEFQLNVGSLVDTLRHDHPHLLVREPDLSLFDEDVEFCVAPLGGTSLRGKANYAKALGSLRWAHRLAATDAEIGHRIIISDGAIRVRWTARLCMRPHTNVIVDGVSVYELDPHTGFVRTHRIETVAPHGERPQLAIDGLANAWGILMPQQEAGAVPC